MLTPDPELILLGSLWLVRVSLSMLLIRPLGLVEAWLAMSIELNVRVSCFCSVSSFPNADFTMVRWPDLLQITVSSMIDYLCMRIVFFIRSQILRNEEKR